MSDEKLFKVQVRCKVPPVDRKLINKGLIRDSGYSIRAVDRVSFLCARADDPRVKRYELRILSTCLTYPTDALD